MKTKEKKEYKAKTIKELTIALSEAKNALFSLRLDHSQKKLKNTRSLYLLGKNISRIRTFIKEKQILSESV